MGRTKRLGHFIMLRDVYGNTYTYAHLKKLVAAYPVPKEKTVTGAQVKRSELELPKKRPEADRRPPAPAAGQPQRAGRRAGRRRRQAAPRPRAGSAAAEVRKERLFAQPEPPGRLQRRRRAAAAQRRQRRSPASRPSSAYFTERLRPQALRRRASSSSSPARKVIAGTILGRIGKTEQQHGAAPALRDPPRRPGAPRIDPKPILDGWKLLESTAIYRAAGKNPFFGPDAKNPSIGQILLMSKEALQHRVLTDPRIEIYDCGRRDIQRRRRSTAASWRRSSSSPPAA